MLVDASSLMTVQVWRMVEFFVDAIDLDVLTIEASDDGFASSTVFLRQDGTLPGYSWTEFTFPLGSFAGSSVEVRFTFDTVDGAQNGLGKSLQAKDAAVPTVENVPALISWK